MSMHDQAKTCAAAAIAVGILCLAAPAYAAPTFVGGGGYDHFAGPGGQQTRTAMAIAGAEAAGGSVSLALMRYSDNQTGDGTGYSLGVGIPLTAGSALRAWGSRFVADESWRSWRVQAGPFVEFPGGATAGLYYSHSTDNADHRSDGVSAELATPLSPLFKGRAGAAYATTPGGLNALQGTVGVGFAPARGVELTADVGLAHNGAILTSPGPSRGPLLPLLGGGSEGNTSGTSRTDTVLLFGVRVLMP